jgi:hypothetical protein
MPETLSYEIQFDGVSLARASEYAKQLESALNDVGDGIEITRLPGDEGHQDFGATLILIFGTPVAVALAERIGDWLKSHRTASLTLKRKDGSEVVIGGVTNKDVIRITDEFLRQP